jgi:poly-D-alanine transfer protein DltD
MNPECRKIEEDKAKNRCFAKAIKSTYDNVPNKQKEMLYSESYEYNEGYFSDIDELIEYCEENESEVPKYVWSTTKNTLSIDACNIVEQACEELHEDAYQNVTDEQELQDFLDKWCDKQSGVDTFMVDYEYAISISE